MELICALFHSTPTAHCEAAAVDVPSIRKAAIIVNYKTQIMLKLV